MLKKGLKFANYAQAVLVWILMLFCSNYAKDYCWLNPPRPTRAPPISACHSFRPCVVRGWVVPPHQEMSRGKGEHSFHENISKRDDGLLIRVLVPTRVGVVHSHEAARSSEPDSGMRGAAARIETNDADSSFCCVIAVKSLLGTVLLQGRNGKVNEQTLHHTLAKLEPNVW